MISRILPFPRGRMKMTKVWNDDETDGEFFCRRQWSIYYGEVKTDGLIYWYEDKNDDGSITKRPLILRNRKALSDFTRVVEETGILDQGRSQKEKSRDE